jgi:hypothetical protein
MTEAYALLLIVLVLAILFTIGLWRTSKEFRRHAEKIKEVFTPYSDYLGFMRYGRGFKALCIPKKGSNFSRIDITVSLTWRENPLFYILYPITKDKDRIFLWGELVEMPDVNIEIRRGESTDPGRGYDSRGHNGSRITDDSCHTLTRCRHWEHKGWEDSSKLRDWRIYPIEQDRSSDGFRKSVYNCDADNTRDNYNAYRIEDNEARIIRTGRAECWRDLQE